jgi:hypothetical protein
VVCGHIHQPQIREVVNKKGSCTYLNSGDWIENLSALEYHDNEWKIFYYDEHKHLLKDDEAEEIQEMDNSELLKIVTNFLNENIICISGNRKRTCRQSTGNYSYLKKICFGRYFDQRTSVAIKG